MSKVPENCFCGGDIMVKYRILLTASEREELKRLLAKGRHASRKVTRARILLLSDEGQTADEIAVVLSVSAATVDRTRRRCAEAGVSGALEARPRPGAKLDERQQARLIAEACSSPGEDRARWTLKKGAGLIKRRDSRFLDRIAKTTRQRLEIRPRGRPRKPETVASGEAKQLPMKSLA
jgi:transposase